MRHDEGVIRDEGPVSVAEEEEAEEKEEDGSGSGGSGTEFTIRLAFLTISFMYSRRLSGEECGISFHDVGPRDWRASWRSAIGRIVWRSELDRCD